MLTAKLSLGNRPNPIYSENSEEFGVIKQRLFPD